jgi:hypothetical protein
MSICWIATPYCTVNLAHVCRIEYRRTDVSRAEINGFHLYLNGRHRGHLGAG